MTFTVVRNLTVVCLMVTLLFGCSSINKILDMEPMFMSGKVMNVVYFANKHLILVKFEKKDPMCFTSIIKAEFWINEVNTIFYVKLPNKIETTILSDSGIEIPTMLQYQIIEVKRGGY